MTARPRIGNAAARNLFLARHMLAGDPRPKQSAADLLTLVERLGFVQLDSINTVARAHDMILFARNQTYRPAHLKRLLERDRALFENWTHDASVIPSRFFPLWQARFERERERLAARWRDWHQQDFEGYLDHVRARIAQPTPPAGPPCLTR